MTEEKRLTDEEFFIKFKEFENSKDYKTKYNESLEFIKENKTGKLKQFDLNDCWKGVNKSNPQIEQILKDYLGLKLDFSFYVYQNRDLLKIEVMGERINNYLQIGLKEVKPFDFDKADNKKIVTLIIIDKYGVKEISGRLVKTETEETLFLIEKRKQRKGYRLNKKERYFLK
jgi:hypothetical protein